MTLKLHHFLPPVSNGHAKFLAPWAQQGRGRIRAAASRSTSSPRCSSAARRRSSTTRPATASPTSSGRCPATRPAASRRSRCSSCRSSPHTRGVVNAKAMQEFYETHAAATSSREVHPICVWAHDHGLDPRQQAGQDDGGPEGPEAALPDAAGRRGAEGARRRPRSACRCRRCRNRWRSASSTARRCRGRWCPPIKVQELVKFHTEIPGSPTLYTATFILAMNKAKYDSLPADLKQVIDANSGPGRRRHGRARCGTSRRMVVSEHGEEARQHDHHARPRTRRRAGARRPSR